MARSLAEKDLSNPTARRRLKANRKPYWRLISTGYHIGYRKPKTGSGSWIARQYVRHLGKHVYEENLLGSADDHIPADNLTVLSFVQAQDRARHWFKEKARAAGDSPEAPSSYTVGRCMQDYLDWYRLHRKAIQQVTYTVEAHVVSRLGEIEVTSLSTQAIRKWHEGIARTPARLRTKPGEKTKFREIETSEDQRKRKASANRALSILKAGLNRAVQEGLVESDEAWRRVKPFRGVEEPRIEYLTEEEAAKVCAACEPDFREVVQGALLTGCRYGELIEMRARDYHPGAEAVYVAKSKNGKPRWVYLNSEGVGFFERIAKGKPAGQRLFSRADGAPWGKSHQARRMTKACEAAGVRRVFFHALRHTYGSLLAMNGVSMAVIAEQLGHSDTRITERHYAHFSPSYVAKVVRANLPQFGI